MVVSGEAALFGGLSGTGRAPCSLLGLAELGRAIGDGTRIGAAMSLSRRTFGRPVRCSVAAVAVVTWLMRDGERGSGV